MVLVAVNALTTGLGYDPLTHDPLTHYDYIYKR